MPNAESNIRDTDSLVDEIEQFLTGSRSQTEPDRVLATVMFTDIVDSTKRAAALGDRDWRRLLDRHNDAVRQEIERFRGRAVKNLGDGFLATFDGPARAVRCAAAIIDRMRPLGIQVRGGLHTGEIELTPDDVAGIAVHIAARVAEKADNGEVLVSSTVRDLVAGSGLRFGDRGSHVLRGFPEPLHLFAASTPPDLAAFDDLDTPTPEPVERGTASLPVPASSTALERETEPERLVDVSNLKAEELAAAHASAVKIDFKNTNSLLAHGEGAMVAIAQSSRQLLTGVRLGDAGEVGRIAASVIDGVKILRIEDLQAEANSTAAAPRKGFVARVIGFAADAHTAFKSFTENRKRFLDLMDGEQARARKSKADLSVAVELMDQQAAAIRHSLHALKIEIAAGQIGLDRGYQELEAQRQKAVQSGEATDAADVMEMRSALANFRGKIADMRESLIGSATLIPIIGQNRKAAETRIMKISDGLLVVIPRLMAVASQAAVQVDIARAAKESEKLDDAARRITVLASKGAHEAATSAARSLGGDARNIEVLAQVADEAIRTMQEVMQIEREVAAGDREREAKLAAIRDRLVSGMRDVHAAALQQ